MRAAILAGGAGKRIGGLFPDIPKPMIPICGKPLLHRQVESLARQGIADITLILGHMSDKIEQYFGDGSAFGVQIEYIVEDEPLGTGGALPQLPREDTLILYGDIYFDIDIERFICFHKVNNAAVTLFAHPNSHPHDSDIIVTDAVQRVIAWKSKKDSNRGDLRNLVNAGIYVFGAEALPGALPRDLPSKRDLEHDIIAPMLPKGRVYAYRSTEYVKDMGTPERLSEVHRAVLTDAVNSVSIAAARSLKREQRAVFIDRDGTLNVLRGLIDSPDQIELIDGADDAIRVLNNSPYLAICVTNQPIVARGMATPEQLDAIHARLDTLLGRQGAYLDDLLFCPHHPDRGYPGEVAAYKIECDCRKPKPGMLLAAAERYNINLAMSCIIGDSTADIAAGKAAGCKTIGVKTGMGLLDGKYQADCDYICEDLREAVAIITGLSLS